MNEDNKNQQNGQNEEENAAEITELEPEVLDDVETVQGGGESSGQAEEAWEQEKEELLDKIRRKQADIDNLRRIGKNEQAEAREYALFDFLTRLLPVLDNIERAIDSAEQDGKVPDAHLKGLAMIKAQLYQLLEQEGVSTIEAAGQSFDPQCHHAVMQVEDEDSEPGTVIEEMQKGYRHRKRILRPAMVKICRDA